MEFLKEAIYLLFQFATGEIPLPFLIVLLALPFLLLLSEMIIRKMIARPLREPKEVLQTLGYSIIGVVVYMFIFRVIVSLISPFTSIDWNTKEVVFIGLLTLVLIALLSPLGTLYTFIKGKMLKSLYLLGSSLLFVWMMNWVSKDIYSNLQIPVYIYIGFGMFYFLCSIVNTNIILMEK